MVDAVNITILGKARVFHFNNYALIELGKVLKVDPAKSADALMQLMNDDVLLAMSAMLYAGVAGYEKSQFNINHGITVEAIAKFVGDATPDEINSFAPAWESFKTSTGISEFLEEQGKKEEEKIKAEKLIRQQSGEPEQKPQKKKK